MQSSIREVEDLQKSYIDTFTTHGVTRLVLGRPLEKVYWGVILIAATVFLCYLFQYNMTRYLRKEIKTEVHTEFRNTVQLPRITVCFTDSIISQLDCYKNRSAIGHHELCSTESLLDKRNVSYYHEGSWIDAFPLGNGCWDMNKDGNVSLGKRDSFRVIIADQNKYANPSLHNTIFVSTQDPKEAHIIRNGSWPMLASDLMENVFYPGNYKVLIDSKVTQRLKAPYPSECLSENEKLNLFSDKYIKVSCVETCWIGTQLKKCGDVIPYYEKFVEDHMERNKTKMSDEERRACLHSFSDLYDDCDCPYQCKETSYYLRSTYRNKVCPEEISNVSCWWELEFKTVNNKVMTVIESADYTYVGLLSDFGGQLGLFVGSSVMSIFEFLAYFMMACHLAYIKMKRY